MMTKTLKLPPVSINSVKPSPGSKRLDARRAEIFAPAQISNLAFAAKRLRHSLRRCERSRDPRSADDPSSGDSQIAR